MRTLAAAAAIGILVSLGMIWRAQEMLWEAGEPAVAAATVAAPDDPAARESQRLGRALIACRVTRREQLCEFSKRCFAAKETFSLSGVSSLSSEDRAACEQPCQVGQMYVQGLDTIIDQVKLQQGDRAGQIKTVYVALARCASGRDLAALGLELPAVDAR